MSAKRLMPDKYYGELKSERATLTLSYTVKRERRKVLVLYDGTTPLFPSFREARLQWEACVREGFRGRGKIERQYTIEKAP